MLFSIQYATSALKSAAVSSKIQLIEKILEIYLYLSPETVA
jgi:hypothetical protein